MAASIRPLSAALALLLGACSTRYTFEPVVTDPVASEHVAVDLFLIGDAGQPDREGEPVLEALQKLISANPEPTYVVWLGDNLYPDGLAPEGDELRELGEWVLDQQMDVMRETGSRGSFVPGNHDWDAGGPAGWEKLLLQQEYIRQEMGDDAAFLPGDGCPGPAVVDVGEVLRLLLIDSQWFLHRDGLRPLHPDSGCPVDSNEEFIEATHAALREAGDRIVVAAAHHPMVSGGHHGGYFDWPAYLIPGYPQARRRGWFAPQDVNAAEYREMRQVLLRAFSVENSPLIYAAGHEHNLQILRGDAARYLVVSGTGIYGHLTPVQVLVDTLYARAASGFARLTIRSDLWSRLAVYEVDASGVATETFSFWIPADSVAARAQP